MQISVFHQYGEKAHFLALNGCGKYTVRIYRCDPFFSLYKSIWKKQSWVVTFKECILTVYHWLVSWLDRSNIRIYALPPTHPLFVPLILLWWRPGKRIYFTSFTDWRDAIDTGRSGLVHRNAKFIIWYFDAVATVNVAAYDYFQTYLPTALVEHSVMVDNFRKQNWQLKDNDRKIIFVGRITSYKRIDLLAEICAERSYRLDIIGPVEDNNILEKINKLATDTVRWLGPRCSHWIQEHLCEYTALILPSDYREPYGIVMLEAIAAGLLVLACRSHGTETLFRNWSDYPLLAPSSRAHDIDALLERFHSMSRDELCQLRKRLLVKVQDYTPVNAVNRWDKILKN